MAISTTQVAIAVVGQEVTVSVLSSDDLTGSAEGEFSAFELNDDSVSDTSGQPLKATWKEPLNFKKVLGQLGKNKKWAAPWTAGIESTKTDIPEKTYLVSVVVRKNSPMKKIPATNKVRIPGIAVTEEPQLREIMTHEFSRQTAVGAGPNNWTFNPAPLRAFIQSLTPQQRALLCAYDKKRLVSFISLRGHKPNRPMCADDCGISKGNNKRQSVLANADFSMFYCEKAGNRVILECHTEYFCVNGANPGTQSFLTAIYSNLSPSGNRPRKYFLAAEPHDLVIYMRLLNSKGDSVMGRNYIHGVVNTKGCWMLFRNYNWPIRARNEFLSIYCRDYRPEGSGFEAAVKSKLKALGYDATADNPTRSDSYYKWRDWDQNYAYSFFFDRLIGVEFFSKAENHDYEPNLYNTHGHTQSATSFTMEEKSFIKANLYPGNADGYNFHEVKKAGSNKMWKDNRNYVWKENVRKHKAAKGWGYAFADIYLFNPDRRPLSELLKSPYTEPPPLYVVPSP